MRGNEVAVVGNVTRDAEVRRVGDSNAVKWGIAWNKPRKNQQTGQWEDVPHYFDCECWASDAQLRAIEGRIAKGAKCAVTGYLEQQRWTDDNGNNRSKTVIRVDDPINGLVLAPPRGQGQQTQEQPQYQQATVYEQPQQGGYEVPPASVYDQDIPF